MTQNVYIYKIYIYIYPSNEGKMKRKRTKKGKEKKGQETEFDLVFAHNTRHITELNIQILCTSAKFQKQQF